MFLCSGSIRNRRVSNDTTGHANGRSLRIRSKAQIRGCCHPHKYEPRAKLASHITTIYHAKKTINKTPSCHNLILSCPYFFFSNHQDEPKLPSRPTGTTILADSQPSPATFAFSSCRCFGSFPPACNFAAAATIKPPVCLRNVTAPFADSAVTCSNNKNSSTFDFHHTSQDNEKSHLLERTSTLLCLCQGLVSLPQKGPRGCHTSQTRRGQVCTTKPARR